ncbi:MAG: hypothetical protein LBL32_01260, partial [Holosporales bacterium]|nr:hypothetical protein [Holosporales bacterium]
MKHTNLRGRSSKQSYLRYNDVFMSHGNPANNRNYNNETMQRSETRDSSYADRLHSRPHQNEDEYQQDDQYMNRYDNEYDEIYDQMEETYNQRPISPYDREYFSNDNSILNERMIKYQKRQLPPLHRYGPNNSRSNYPAPQMMYWDEDE